MNFKNNGTYKFYKELALPPFKDEDARTFFLKTKTDPAAREEFFRRNILLALTYAEKFYNLVQHIYRFEPDELIQEAMRGLDHQIDRYDPTIAAFSTFYCNGYVRSKFRDLLNSSFYKHMDGVVSLDELIDSDREWNTRIPDPQDHLEKTMGPVNHRSMLEGKLAGDDLVYVKERLGFDDCYRDFGKISVSEIARRHDVSRYRVEKSLERSFAKLRDAAPEYGYVS